LIIVLPVAIMQGLITWIFFDLHWQAVSSGLTDSLAGDVAWITETYEGAPADLPRLAARAERNLSLSVAFKPGETLSANRKQAYCAREDRALEAALDRRLDRPFWFNNRSYNGWVQIEAPVQGGVLRIYAPRERAFAASGWIFIIWMAGATLLLTAIA